MISNVPSYKKTKSGMCRGKSSRMMLIANIMLLYYIFYEQVKHLHGIIVILLGI